MNAAQTKDLCFTYDPENSEYVLSDINISIKKGGFTVIAGRNGSGKSTLAKHFNAINLPTGGKVYVCGMETAAADNIFEIRSRAGMVFQNPDNQMVAALVENEVAFAPENLGIEPSEIRKRVENALEAVGLSGFEKRSTSALSGGEKQRVAIAAVLAMEPELIILDEATAMLDPRGRNEVMTAVRDINKKLGTTVIHITHHMDEAVLSDRVIVMDKGKIIADAAPEEVFFGNELIEAAGLEAPIMAELSYELKKRGIDISALTQDEMYEKLCRMKNND